jgi:hypothetical protein
MKHYLVFRAASFSGGLHGVAKVRKNGACQGIRQCKHLLRGLEVFPEIVNNDGRVKDAPDFPQLPSEHLFPMV